MQRLKKDLEDETIKSREIEEQLRQIGDNGSEQRAHMDNVNTRVRDYRQKKSDIAAQKTYEYKFDFFGYESGVWKSFY
jgi:hypothetical protein